MHKRSVIDQIEINRDGAINIRIAKEVVDDDGTVLSSAWHRTCLPPGHDIDGQMEVVNQHLTEGLKCAAVEAADIARIKTFVPAAWTPEALQKQAVRNEAARAEMEARLAAQEQAEEREPDQGLLEKR